MAKIYFAADHAAVDLKTDLLKYAIDQGHEGVDLGTDTKERVHYPVYADQLAQALKDDPQAYGVLLCASGIGISIAANRHRHIRAALCLNAEMAALTRGHNHANVLCLGSRFVDIALAQTILDVFLETPPEGGRHAHRVAMMS